MTKNLRRVMGAVALLFLASCAGGEDEATDSPLESTEQGVIYCGPLCPPNYATVGFACSTACPGGCPNAVSCAPIPTTVTLWGTPQTVTVPVGQVGTSRICWNTSGLSYPVWIKVSANGAPEQLFTKESDRGKHCENAPWIQAPGTYVFTIKTAKEGGSVLATTTVFGVTP
ncbi:hypothetical protein LZ198_31390 [Myxococcus sp. K15C18031901]|uniref:hypothetical protein n=1 Tax=Myxococcus dinghuensis TaxID=2906761 RepID=UPI0020A78681|nr:hypothetical protein [Myxococcus dinghuensis]MCP3103397.1 hypothetical protein [Myxococcus dinghuensis]